MQAQRRTVAELRELLELCREFGVSSFEEEIPGGIVKLTLGPRSAPPPDVAAESEPPAALPLTEEQIRLRHEEALAARRRIATAHNVGRPR
jgi:hypothetical protein